jgi:REP element-mobilizing transposase RayT
MGKTTGYMLTWTTYGTWLQGDKRRWVKDGKVFEPNSELEEANKESQINGSIKLNDGQKEIVETAILEEAEKIGEKIPAILVWSNHVHIVVEGGINPIEEVVSRFKNAAYFALRKKGYNKRIWTRGYDKRFCFDKESLQERIKYVKGHKEKKTIDNNPHHRGGG